jgi:hypothetical protein
MVPEKLFCPPLPFVQLKLTLVTMVLFGANASVPLTAWLFGPSPDHVPVKKAEPLQM